MSRSHTFKTVREKDRLIIEMGSTLEAIDGADAQTKAFLEEKGLAAHSFHVRLLAREGLSNAIRHGHADDPKKTVRYVVAVEPGRVVLTFTDQGGGFDWRARMQRKPNPEDEGGRGLWIMQTYASEYCYNEKGNELTLVRAV